MPAKKLNNALDSAFALLDEGRERYVFSPGPREVGSVISVSAGIVIVSGLP